MLLDGFTPDLKGKQITDTTMDVYPSGINHMMEGVKSNDFEWNSKSQHNALYGLLGRHTAPNAEYDPEVLNEFRAFSKKFLDMYFDQFERMVVISMDKNGGYNPLKWVDGKSVWTANKKEKYITQMTADFVATEKAEVSMCHNFTTMVKKGEVYVTQQVLSEHEGVLVGEPSRPRNIFVPPDHNCTHPVYFQSLLWEPLRVFPGFIQGFTKKQYQNWIINAISDGWLAVSIDGSGFDSTQFAELMDCCENALFERLERSERVRSAFRRMC